jgi:hypothetical protein
MRSNKSTTTNIVKGLTVISGNSSLQLAGLVSIQIRTKIELIELPENLPGDVLQKKSPFL